MLFLVERAAAIAATEERWSVAVEAEPPGLLPIPAVALLLELALTRDGRAHLLIGRSLSVLGVAVTAAEEPRGAIWAKRAMPAVPRRRADAGNALRTVSRLPTFAMVEVREGFPSAALRADAGEDAGHGCGRM